jgi:hypothetical protein
LFGFTPQFANGNQSTLDAITQCNSEIFRMCVSHKQQFVLIWNQILSKPGSMSRDGIHLSLAGKAILSHEISLAVADHEYVGNWGH